VEEEGCEQVQAWVCTEDSVI